MTEFEDRLKEIKERCEKATPAPWIVKPREDRDAIWEATIASENSKKDICWGEHECGSHYYSNCFDADFIAHSREDIPWLISQLELHRKALELQSRAHSAQERSRVMMEQGVTWEDIREFWLEIVKEAAKE